MVTYFLDSGPSESSQLEMRDEIADLPVKATEQTPILSRPKTLVRQNDISLTVESPIIPSISPSQSIHSTLSHQVSPQNYDDLSDQSSAIKPKKAFADFQYNDSLNQSKSSIENLECLLKNDISLSDLNTRNYFKEYGHDTKSSVKSQSRTSNEFTFKNTPNLSPTSSTTNTQFNNNLPKIKMSQSMYLLKVNSNKCTNTKNNYEQFKVSKSLNTLNNISQTNKYILEDITNKID